MSQIKILFRMSDQSFLFTPKDLAPDYCDLMAGIVKESARLNMDRVSFGYSLKRDGEEISSKSWPPPNVRYVQTDQEVIEVERVFFYPEEELTIDFWLDYGGNHLEDSYTFTTPRPAQPYDSWTWDAEAKQWVPPVPYPDDGGMYTWDEEAQEWVLIPDPTNVNTATFDELRELNGVDEVRAQAIIDGREWADINDLSSIQGISQEMIDSWDITV